MPRRWNVQHVAAAVQRSSRSAVAALRTLHRTPSRRYDAEHLEDPALDRAVVVRSLRDITRSNVVFGGRAAAIAELRMVWPALPATALLLDVGTGLGDIPARAAREAAKRQITLHTVGLDTEFVLARQAQPRLTASVCGNATSLPVANRSVDVAICSQLLHHFRGDAARALLQELNRVARVAVIISDLRRCWVAAGGFWLASFPLQFHPVTRHDGVVSVMRGFTAAELADTVEDAIGTRPLVHQRHGFRLTTHWTPR
jgi:SAM-dependent methyltransferase